MAGSFQRLVVRGWERRSACRGTRCDCISRQRIYSSCPTQTLKNPKPASDSAAEPAESFQDLLSQFEKSHSHKPEEGSKRLEATVVTLTAESVLLDIGFKTEGIIPLAEFRRRRNREARRQAAGLHQGPRSRRLLRLLSARLRGPRTGRRWRRRSTRRPPIAGTVTGAVKGGLSVDVGVRAFMPASRSGARDAAEMEKLVGPGNPLPHHQARCRR